MILVSLTVAVLVVLAVLLIVLQCWKFRGRFRRFRRKSKKENSEETRSQSDSDYSSYSGEEGDTLEQSTVFSERTVEREVNIYDHNLINSYWFSLSESGLKVSKNNFGHDHQNKNDDEKIK